MKGDTIINQVDEKALFTGRLEESYANGKIWESCNYKNGKLHGLREIYYDNGRLKMRETYKHGLRNGAYEYRLGGGRMIWKRGIFIKNKHVGLWYEKYYAY
jgi:antitoxin component YwqK of YwqJK toxin-antitoxin module